MRSLLGRRIVSHSFHSPCHTSIEADIFFLSWHRRRAVPRLGSSFSLGWELPLFQGWPRRPRCHPAKASHSSFSTSADSITAQANFPRHDSAPFDHPEPTPPFKRVRTAAPEEAHEHPRNQEIRRGNGIAKRGRMENNYLSRKSMWATEGYTDRDLVNTWGASWNLKVHWMGGMKTWIVVLKAVYWINPAGASTYTVLKEYSPWPILSD